MRLVSPPPHHTHNKRTLLLGILVLVAIGAVFSAIWSMQPLGEELQNDLLHQGRTRFEPRAPLLSAVSLLLAIILTLFAVPMFLINVDRESAMVVGFCAVMIGAGVALGGYLNPESHRAFSKLLNGDKLFSADDYFVYGGFFYLLVLIASALTGSFMAMANQD